MVESQISNQFKPLMNATSTPLSSIFGSGFLIIVPILAGAVGTYSVFAMGVSVRWLTRSVALFATTFAGGKPL